MPWRRRGRCGLTEEYERYMADQAHAWLASVEADAERVDELEAVIEQARDRASGMRGIDYSSLKVSGGGGPYDRMAESVAAVQEQVAAYCRQLADLTARQADAHRRLAPLKPEQRGCLVRHYLLGRPWPQVCGEMGYTYDGMMKLRRRSLVSAYAVMPASERDPVQRAI